MKQKKFSLNVAWILRAAIMMAADVLVLYSAYFFALFLRFDFTYSDIPAEYLGGWKSNMPYWGLATVVVFFFFRLYHSVWRFVGIIELRNLLLSYLILIPVYALITYFVGDQMLVPYDRMPISYYIMGGVLAFLGACAIRFGYRFLRFLTHSGSAFSGDIQRVMIIGAGMAAESLIRELTATPNKPYKLCCVIDDNPVKKGRFIDGVEIVGDRYQIVKAVAKYNINRIIFCIPTCPAQDRIDILNICKETGCKIQVVPGVFQLDSQEYKLGKIRDVEITDLLGREQIRVDNGSFFATLSEKVVLVTGGGGSIGSELCRQIAAAGPKKLVIFDIYENNAYDIQQELVRKYPNLNLEVLIGSVRNTNRINFVMKTYRPHLVFHAAAHKHVPLMETSPNEAIKNNVLGTYKTAVAAERYGVEKFILISTDKAVNPTNIMGASKRLCEMVVQMMERQSKKTSFCAVRFGNVLGSNGSVIPLFKKQIAEGGPLTITDKRIIRYFMTIPEAVSLVLQAACYAKGGEIFILDMGEPVKIDEMARNLIRLSGLRPDVDIEIKYTGLRPGEKLYEELLMDEEGLQETENKLIHIGKPIEMDDDFFLNKIRELEIATKNETDKTRALVAELVPTYQYKK